jgi:hypothetical protein
MSWMLDVALAVGLVVQLKSVSKWMSAASDERVGKDGSDAGAGEPSGGHAARSRRERARRQWRS